MAFNTNFDLNKGLENPKTRSFARTILYTLLVLVVILVMVFIIQTCEGKHVRTPIIETNIPVETLKKDSEVNNNTQKMEVNVKENKGEINMNKTINYNNQK
jgi:hypothetical protein